MKYIKLSENEGFNKTIGWIWLVVNMVIIFWFLARVLLQPVDSCFKDCEIITIHQDDKEIIRGNCSYIQSLWKGANYGRNYEYDIGGNIGIDNSKLVVKNVTQVQV